MINSDPYGYTYKEICDCVGEKKARSLMHALYKEKPQKKYQTMSINDIYNGGDTRKCTSTIWINAVHSRNVAMSMPPNNKFFFPFFFIILRPFCIGLSFRHFHLIKKRKMTIESLFHISDTIRIIPINARFSLCFLDSLSTKSEFTKPQNSNLSNYQVRYLPWL